MRKNQKLVVFLIILLGLGCKTNKEVVYSGPVPELSKDVLYQCLIDHNNDFDWYTCVASVDLNSPDEDVSGKAYIRMKKDSIIWSSFKKLGIEAVRSLMTAKEVIAVNRLDQTYQRSSLDQLIAKNGISFNFQDMQQALYGNVIIPEKEQCQISQEGEFYLVKAVDTDLQLKYWIHAYTKQIQRASITDYRGRELSIYLDDYKDVGSVKIPFHRTYSLPAGNKDLARIDMKIKEVELVEKKTIFNIPNHYEQVY